MAYSCEYQERYRNSEKGIRARRRGWLKFNYGMTLEEFEALEHRQGGVCAICGDPPAGGRRRWLDVDHCHRTGLVRGLLCRACNLSLGKMKDCPELLRAAAEYLESSDGLSRSA